VQPKVPERTFLSIQQILTAIETNIPNVGNHYFQQVTTFGFKGDTIVESCNNAMKHSSISVDGRNSLDTSAINQIRLVQDNANERNR
jgi:hypothetical protein